MKIVQLKLESKDVNSYLKHFRKAKTIFFALIVTSLIAEGFEIPWTVIIEKIMTIMTQCHPIYWEWV